MYCGHERKKAMKFGNAWDDNFFQATDIKITPTDFRPTFIARMIPKVEWPVLVEAVKSVRNIINGLLWMGFPMVSQKASRGLRAMADVMLWIKF